MGPTVTVKRLRFMNAPVTGCQCHYQATTIEQTANILTHGVWIIPAIYALLKMLTLSTTQNQYWIAWWYGMALILLFSTSTSFHISSLIFGNNSMISRFLHFWDRSTIFTFIASCFMPWFVLTETLSNTYVMKWLVCIWLMAMLGITFTYLFLDRYKLLETLLYVILGVVPSIPILYANQNSGAWELTAGGGIYVMGILFFKCDGRIPFAHAIWHTFVACGALIHYSAVIRYKY
ncbi:Monocyte to macrophage differentiation factor 2 [Trichoplax sp. H2]|nr:Monocyte to macrophage differentiation factor 2 [Trichoplax sp. H2]|eukprot:RDD44390.1 Monocyte to macrophage differentiation factor 2 [Trichoplax sp. H2]